MKYNIGTVSVTNGDATVTGDGSQDFLAELTAGELFSVAGSGISYTIGSVTDADHFELAANYAGADASGLSYTVVQSFTPEYDLPYPDIGDVQTATILKRTIQLIDSLLVPATATTAQLVDKTNLVNTKFKKLGKCVWNSTTGKPVYASGTADTSVWKDATGTLAHTPA